MIKQVREKELPVNACDTKMHSHTYTLTHIHVHWASWKPLASSTWGRRRPYGTSLLYHPTILRHPSQPPQSSKPTTRRTRPLLGEVGTRPLPGLRRGPLVRVLSVGQEGRARTHTHSRGTSCLAGQERCCRILEAASQIIARSPSRHI